MNTARAQAAKVDGVYLIQQVPQGEAEIQEVRYRDTLKPLASTSARAILAVRVEFSEQASDSDKKVRMGPVGIRLVANGTNYYPLGTLDAQNGVVYANKPDDFLIIEPNKPVDFVFDVSRGDVLKGTGGGKPNDRELQVADGVFVEIKRMVRASIGGKPVSLTIESAESGVIRKTDAGATKIDGVSLNMPAPPAAPAAAAAGAATGVASADAAGHHAVSHARASARHANAASDSRTRARRER